MREPTRYLQENFVKDSRASHNLKSTIRTAGSTQSTSIRIIAGSTTIHKLNIKRTPTARSAPMMELWPSFFMSQIPIWPCTHAILFLLSIIVADLNSHYFDYFIQITNLITFNTLTFNRILDSLCAAFIEFTKKSFNFSQNLSKLLQTKFIECGRFI